MKRAEENALDRERLCEILTAFHSCTGLPAQLLDESGAVLESHGEENSYCRLLARQVFTPSACQAAHLSAARRAQSLGESYIFACPASLNLIAFPLLIHGALLAEILVGPFLMDAPDSTLVSGLCERRPLPGAALLELYDELGGVPVVPPDKVQQISKLLYFLLSPLNPAHNRRLVENQEKLSQQAHISETIRMYKEQGASGDEPYPFEKERELLTKVRTGDVQAAKGVLNDLLGYVFFCEGGRMDTMKNRSLELCTLLSRTAIEGGAVTDAIFRMNNQFLSRLTVVDTLEALCYQLQEIVEAFMSATFAIGDKPGSEPIRKAVAYIARRYAQPLTLPAVSRHVGLSAAYFSTLFKQNTGSSFREYLNQVRVEESKRLLAETDYSLVDIAMAMGFSDQSYYTKVFKKYTGLTPKQYR